MLLYSLIENYKGDSSNKTGNMRNNITSQTEFYNGDIIKNLSSIAQRANDHLISVQFGWSRIIASNILPPVRPHLVWYFCETQTMPYKHSTLTRPQLFFVNPTNVEELTCTSM